jgi:hypothetical protein
MMIRACGQTREGARKKQYGVENGAATGFKRLVDEARFFCGGYLSGRRPGALVQSV